MKRMLMILAALVMVCGVAVAEEPISPPRWDIDLSDWSFYELTKLQEKIDLVIDDALSVALSTLPDVSPIPNHLDVSISSVKIGENSIGSPEIHVVLKNESSTLTIDRVDFRIKCYDAYGDLIKLYNRYTYSACFYDGTLKPGYKSPENHRWTIYDGDGTRTVQVAIEKYHATDGTTVSVPEDQLEWIEFEK